VIGDDFDFSFDFSLVFDETLRARTAQRIAVKIFFRLALAGDG